MAEGIKAVRIKCKGCGARFIEYRLEKERLHDYCDLCRLERNREQSRLRMQAMRARRS